MDHSHQSKTAILIFANSSKEEVKHKRIANDQKLFDTLTSLTIKTAEKSRLPYFHYSEKEQIGCSFGERFTNAIQAVFEKGFDNVITIGNDTPKLKAAHLIEANGQLQKNKFVIGPSLDGGFYLMGINKKQFNAKMLLNLPWQRSNLSKLLLDSMASNHGNEVSFLPTLLDLDAARDIKKLWDYVFLLPKELLTIFLLLLYFIPVYGKLVLLFFLDSSPAIFFNKGSPVLQSQKFKKINLL